MVTVSREIRSTDVLCPTCEASWVPKDGGTCSGCLCPETPQLHHEFFSVREELRRAVPASAFYQWMDSLHSHGVRDGRLQIGCHPTVIEWNRKRFTRLLQDITGKEIDLVRCTG